MALTNKNYNQLIENLKLRKGKRFLESTISFLNNILTPKKEHSDYDIYQTYRFESYLRTWLYVYIDVIEKSILGYLLDLNEEILTEEFSYENGWTFTWYFYKVFMADRINLEYTKPLNWDSISGHNESNLIEPLEHMKNTGIFSPKIIYNTETLEIIRKTRNQVQHFSWVLDNENSQLKNFVSLFSSKYQESLGYYVISEILLTFTTYETAMELIYYLRDNFGLFQSNEFKKIITDIEKNKPGYSDKVDGKSLKDFNNKRLQKNKVSKKSEQKPIKDQKDWPYYCSYIYRRNLGIDLNSKIREKIFSNNAGIKK